MQNSKHIKYAKISLTLAIAPITVLFIGFIFCLIRSDGGGSDNDGGAIWWLFVFLLLILILITPIASLVSIFLGIKSMKENKILFAYLGIGISTLNLLGVLCFVLYLAT